MEYDIFSRNETERRIIESKVFQEAVEYGMHKIKRNSKGSPEGYAELKAQYIAPHAFESYKIAQEFSLDESILGLVKYHDTGFLFFQAEKKGAFEKEKFEEIFWNIDCENMVKFVFSDSARREKDTSYWLESSCLSMNC